MKAIDVANWFLARNRADYECGYTDELISNLKLQKLLYYAQGSFLALTGKPVFDEEIYAWEHGPVVPEIYHLFKDNGKNGIDFENGFDFSKFGKEANNILESVYQEFGQFSAWRLRTMTHEETPWKETPKNQVINKSSIEKYFKENYVA